ncbi:hypothetical protein [Sphaerotilus mobilis]|uniref:Uncharacterized protein n=1 Tax=Sphaerotilus mobilis TaxID=47994 RepID=A0A4Q7LCN3_9BURK|nr:hypothetical protein [Sphaerotilus mobilis]RZS47470.1 hypothetical protein EV685_3675 [Sphaerotilus mobilis]
MQALRLIVNPVDRRLVIDLPDMLASGACEVIILPVDPRSDVTPERLATRRPSAKLIETRMKDDLTASVAADDEWDALK